MRRNKKRNVYTNRTIKRCPYNCYYCDICKSYCKVYYLNNEEPKYEIVGHDYYTNKKLHQIGIGSLLPGKTMISIQKNRGYDDRSYRKDHLLLKLRRKRQILKELTSDVLLSDFMYRVDLVKPHN